jgi:hypothetical protein
MTEDLGRIAMESERILAPGERVRKGMARLDRVSLSILEFWVKPLGWLGSVLRPQKLRPSA